MALAGTAVSGTLWSAGTGSRGLLNLPKVRTVTGLVDAGALGWTLTHEHVLVDFIGAERTGYHRWDRAEVVDVVLPRLLEAKARGVRTLVECTPAYIGRDPVLLRELSERAEMYLITNTGYYGAAGNKFLPGHAYTGSADQLAERWIRETERGIEGTGIRPGFIKIGVAPGPLSPLHGKLVRAAARAQRATGLTIASHTGPAEAAFAQMDVLEDEGVALENFIWVHAQNEPDEERILSGARRGAWVSLDHVNAKDVGRYAGLVERFVEAGLLNRLLLSHDAGWYRPGEPGGGKFRPYTDLFDHLLPALAARGWEREATDRILRVNPGRALS
jgi:phosphotriesterase-related protein